MWKLEDAEAMAKRMPDAMEIPPLEARQNLQPGDFAKLMFMAPRAKGEREWGTARELMWVEVKEVLGKGKYEGVLASQPVIVENVEMGFLIKFSAKNVMAIEDSGALFHPNPMNFNMNGAFDAFEIWRSNEPAHDKPAISEDDFWYYAAPEEVKARTRGRGVRPGGREEAQEPRQGPPRHDRDERESIRSWRPSSFSRPSEGERD